MLHIAFAEEVLPEVYVRVRLWERFAEVGAVILEPPKIKSATVSPSICHEVMGPDATILVF